MTVSQSPPVSPPITTTHPSTPPVSKPASFIREKVLYSNIKMNEVSDRIIRNAIKVLADPDHPDGPDVDEINRRLDDVQTQVQDNWDMYMQACKNEQEKMYIVYEDQDVVVLAGAEGYRNDELNDVTAPRYRMRRDILRRCHRIEANNCLTKPNYSELLIVERPAETPEQTGQ